MTKTRIKRGRKVLFRAGTDECPSFVGEEVNKDEVWLIEDPNLYYPLGQDKEPSPNTRANPTVFLWKADFECPKTVIIKTHPKFKGICVIKGKEGVGSSGFLKTLNWEKCEVPPSVRKGPGMSVMDFKVIVQAVLEYMIENPPKTPENFNFLAELKAASHWQWLDDDKALKLVPGPHDNPPLRKALTFALQTWKTDLVELKKQTAEGKQDLEESDSLFGDDYKYISELKKNIFSLTMYYRGTLEELGADDGSTSTLDQPLPSDEGDYSGSRKRRKVEVPSSIGHEYRTWDHKKSVTVTQ